MIFVTMRKHAKLIGGIVLALAAIAAAAWFLRDANFAVLQPKGTIGQQQKDLLLFGVFLSIFVVVPVFILLIFISTKYRETNKKADYEPEWDHNKKFELVWWAIPILLIAILSVVTWRSSHYLDPFRPLKSDKKPLTIQVVALQWKWLFIYPDQDIATVNYVEMPINRPVQFMITSDAPMNSFWIPQLGGQIYAMSGMSTQLHLMATSAGNYHGVSANLSGSGFAGMQFTANASAESDFNRWVDSVKDSPDSLNHETYESLAEPSKNNPVSVYSSVEPGLYDTIVMKYMLHTGGAEHTHEVVQE
jgi:cytochrome o ubiquinol oxidase subunit 2